jgi:hypothetical protein
LSSRASIDQIAMLVGYDSDVWLSKGVLAENLIHAG